MSKKSNVPLVTSTPHQTKTRQFFPILESDGLSPICLSAKKVKGTRKPSRATLKEAAKLPGKDEKNVKKKKCTSTQEKESASRAVLKEMGVTMKVKSKNILSLSSHNMYNLYPEPIVLDSDEETDNPATANKHLEEKKGKAITKPSTSSIKGKDVDRKKRIVKTRNDSTNSKDGVKENKLTAMETPLASTSTTRAVKKRQLRSQTITTPQDQNIIKSRKTQSTTEQDKNSKHLDLEDSIFCNSELSVHLSSKKKCLKDLPLLEDIIEESAIKWTPRSKNKINNVKEEVDESDFEESESVSCASKTNKVEHSSKDTIVKKGSKKADLLVTKVANDKNKNPFPRELCSRFEDIVFNPSKKHKGCTVASSLVAGSSDFGYLELEGKTSFDGKIPNVTYVLLEGQVKACYQEYSQTLAQGDILHIHQDSGYRFQNLQSNHARFLFVKIKHSFS